MSLVQQPLLIGAWIGLIHAFDADHITTLSNLAVRARRRSALAYAARWACGHAVAIASIGTLAIGVGMLWISSLSRVAEVAVALLLIALGANTIRRGRSAAARISSASAERLGPATGLLMGLLHGGAGSAAVLAILPLTGFDSNGAALVFLAAFSIGVAAGALLFAAAFSGLVLTALRGGARLSAAFAAAIGAVAIVVGSSMLIGVFDVG